MAADQNISKFLFEVVLSAVTAYFSYFLFFCCCCFQQQQQQQKQFSIIIINSECPAPPEPISGFYEKHLVPLRGEN